MKKKYFLLHKNIFFDDITLGLLNTNTIEYPLLASKHFDFSKHLTILCVDLIIMFSGKFDIPLVNEIDQMRLISHLVQNVIGLKKPSLEVFHKTYDKFNVSLDQKWDFFNDLRLDA